MKRIPPILYLLLLALSNLAQAEPFKVAFIPKGDTHTFWTEMARGAGAAAKELKIDLDWRGPMDEEGIEAQNGIMNIYLRAKYDGIILAPNSPTQLMPTITQASKAGMKIIVVDSPLTAGAAFPYVGTNNEKAGGLAAQQAAKDFPQARKILLYRYSYNHGSTTEREKGFLETIRKLLPNAVVNDTFYSGVTVRDSISRLKEIFLTQNDFDLIFTPNESGTEGTIKALKDMGLAGKVNHYGFDFNEPINEALKANALRAVVVQDPYLMGKMSMKLMLDALKKRPVPMIYETPAVVVTSKNLSSPVVKEKTDPFLKISGRKP